MKVSIFTALMAVLVLLALSADAYPIGPTAGEHLGHGYCDSKAVVADVIPAECEPYVEDSIFIYANGPFDSPDYTEVVNHFQAQLTAAAAVEAGTCQDLLYENVCRSMFPRCQTIDRDNLGFTSFTLKSPYMAWGAPACQSKMDTLNYGLTVSLRYDTAAYDAEYNLDHPSIVMKRGENTMSVMELLCIDPDYDHHGCFTWNNRYSDFLDMSPSPTCVEVNEAHLTESPDFDASIDAPSDPSKCFKAGPGSFNYRIFGSVIPLTDVEIGGEWDDPNCPTNITKGLLKGFISLEDAAAVTVEVPGKSGSLLEFIPGGTGNDCGDVTNEVRKGSDGVTDGFWFYVEFTAIGQRAYGTDWPDFVCKDSCQDMHTTCTDVPGFSASDFSCSADAVRNIHLFNWEQYITHEDPWGWLDEDINCYDTSGNWPAPPSSRPLPPNVCYATIPPSDTPVYTPAPSTTPTNASPSGTPSPTDTPSPSGTASPTNSSPSPTDAPAPEDGVLETAHPVLTSVLLFACLVTLVLF